MQQPDSQLTDDDNNAGEHHASPPHANQGYERDGDLPAVPRTVVATIDRYGTSRCVRRTFRVAVTGLFIRKVVFTVGGTVITTRTRAPFQATVGVLGGVRTITARVTFTDAAHRPSSTFGSEPAPRRQ